MLLVAEEARVGQRQLHQRRLQRADELLHRPQQPRVARNVVHHQRHHLHAQGLAQALHLRPLRGGGVAVCARRGGRAWRAQALHHLAHLVHLLQRLKRRRHRHRKVSARWVDVRQALCRVFKFPRKPVCKRFLAVVGRGMCFCRGGCVIELAQQQAVAGQRQQAAVFALGDFAWRAGYLACCRTVVACARWKWCVTMKRR